MADPVNNPETLTFLQYALGVGTAIGAALAAFIGVRAKTRRRDDPPATAGAGVQWFLDGPIGKALDLLDGIYREIKQQREDHQRYANENNRKHDEQTALLRDLGKKQDEAIRLLEDVKEKLHDLTFRPHSQRHD